MIRRYVILRKHLVIGITDIAYLSGMILYVVLLYWCCVGKEVHMKKKGNRHKTQRAHRRALKRAAIITMAGAAVIIGAYSLKVYDFRIKYT